MHVALGHRVVQLRLQYHHKLRPRKRDRLAPHPSSLGLDGQALSTTTEGRSGSTCIPSIRPARSLGRRTSALTRFVPTTSTTLIFRDSSFGSSTATTTQRTKLDRTGNEYEDGQDQDHLEDGGAFLLFNTCPFSLVIKCRSVILSLACFVVWSTVGIAKINIRLNMAVRHAIPRRWDTSGCGISREPSKGASQDFPDCSGVVGR